MLPSGLQVGTGARVVATERLFTQGNLVTTDNALDVAIQGRGFLRFYFLTVLKALLETALSI